MISVIVPAHNASATLEACLRAIGAQEHLAEDYEMIVVDDGSTDDTTQIAEDLGARVIRQAYAGPAAARNAGAGIARGEILAFTDADCAPTPCWLARLTEPFIDPCVVGSKGTYRTHQKSLVARFVQQEYESKYARMARQASIDFIDTYSAAYRCRVFWENGGFETAFPVPSVEDQELSFRLARKGYRLVFVPQAAVYHQHDQTLGEYVRRKYGIGYWKAFMLRWLSETIATDSHTPFSQRAQIGLLALVGFFLAVSLVWSSGAGLALASLALFYATTLAFEARLFRADRPVALVAPFVLLCRAAALGAGLGVGFVFPPTAHARSVVHLRLLASVLKRTLDVLGALVGLMISMPFMLIAAGAIKLDSPGPVLFSQERAGAHGKPFRMFKLRTMGEDAPAQVHQVLAANHLRGPVFKIRDDPRITRVGRVLRRWSIDEIPQLWNVLRGEMSLVGPRPEETWVVARYDDRQRQRLVVKPGLTGPMQVAGRGELDMEERLRLDLEYIEHYTLWNDLVILARTIPAIISGKGAL